MTAQDSFRYPPDEPNPYAPPQSSTQWEPAATATSLPATIGDVLERTWEIYRDRMGLCIGVCVTYGILLGGVLFASGVVVQAVWEPMDPVPPLVAVGWMLVFFLFVLWISLGLMRVMLDIARGREVSTGGLFQGGRFLLRTIVATLLCTLAVMLVAGAAAFLAAFMAGMMMGAVQARSALGVLLVLMGVTVAAAYIAVFVFALRLSQFLYLIIDRDTGALDSLHISFRITRGHVGMLFVLTILAGLINLCGMMPCGIGVLFTMPYILLLMAVAYLALSGQTAVDPYAKGEPLLEL